MIEFSKSFESFDDLIQDLVDTDYSDEVIDRNFECSTYNDLLTRVIDYTGDDMPGIENVRYPNCISMSVSPYGFRYMNNNIGLSISTRYDRRNKNISYILSYCFNKDRAMLGGNKLFVQLDGDDSYSMREFTKTRQVPKEKRDSKKDS